ncbi:MAG: Gfo/Idh/MocA family oxidoreductase [Planctomycetales bacterium]|nr:Gfo/Idh/MocA family oxidoreductase [Planctomycetales bacterium]
MTEKLRWGILGTGMIARKFAAQLPESRSGSLAAVGSRNSESAIGFANEFGGAPRTPYEGVLSDPRVDAVYNSLPNGMHAEWSIRALEAGKHVLCEKPLASSAAEAEKMFQAAERTGRLLVEAFMYRSHPAVERFIEMARAGAIGDLKLLRTNFTFQRAASMSDARYQPNMAGGSLMDVGCYCVNLARAVVGQEPIEHHALARLWQSGVDEYAAGTLKFPGDVFATFTCGMTVQSDLHATVAGSEGFMRIHAPWFSDGTFTVVRGDQEETVTVPADRGLYALEADAFADAVRGDAPPAITVNDSRGNMQSLDALRRAAGVKF